MIGDMEIDYRDFPDTIELWDNYDPQTVPTVSYENFMFLADKYNELVDFVESLEEEIETLKGEQE